VPVGTAAIAIPAAGLSIVCVIVLTAAFTACVAFGFGGGWCALGFGVAFVAGRCWGGADAVVPTTGRGGVVATGAAVDELVEVLVVLGGAGATTRAAGAGSGPSVEGAFTGAGSGPPA
jgi:hypothetical protein